MSIETIYHDAIEPFQCLLTACISYSTKLRPSLCIAFLRRCSRLQRAFEVGRQSRQLLEAAMSSSDARAALEKDKGAKRPKVLVGDYDVKGLALAWDDNSQLRSRMRQGFNLIVHQDVKLKRLTNHEPEKSTVDCKANLIVLSAVCSVMSTHQGQLPSVEKLAAEIHLFYGMSDRAIAKDFAHKQAWAIRHLIGVLKSTTRVIKKTGEVKIPKDS